MSDNHPIIRVSKPQKHKKHGSALLRVFGSWLLWIIVFGALIGGAFTWSWLNFTAPGPLDKPKTVQLPVGADHSAIAVALADQGVISNPTIFSAAAYLQELRHAKLRSGEYEFPAGATMDDVLAMIIRGQVLTYKVTIPEGWTSQMVVNRLNDQDQLQGNVLAEPEEGSLLPETYVMSRGYPREKLLADMAAAQTKYLDQAWSRLPAGSPIKSKKDLVTLASVVERETSVPEERPMVAAVFLNRLKANMRLQSDPTVIYGIAGGKGKLDHPLTRSELDAPTPYNTYTNDGLPSGPIGNPGKASIEAVLNPANVKYLYFVANGLGGHAFANTLDEHNANVKKWRALINAPAPDASPTASPKATSIPKPMAPGEKPAPVPAPAPDANANSMPAPDVAPVAEPATPEVPATPPVTAKPEPVTPPVKPAPATPTPAAKPAPTAKPAVTAPETAKASAPATAKTVPAQPVPPAKPVKPKKKIPVPVPKKPQP
ncbi:endolytic transglycosylase MltG [Aestuariivirga litoralis]|uniref:endolytic transglycosylase MltG n=1 Tax=Aestuariivirga litoralis TaxID=2650924 RepID=UPI0018C71BFB|nr:endolytic transglycosylase MltG [Aestuariivirga litoralis]MBG1232033.1 endolytic transglycosylase MltG [Aestuariivirga litoralis]